MSIMAWYIEDLELFVVVICMCQLPPASRLEDSLIFFQRQLNVLQKVRFGLRQT